MRFCFIVEVVDCIVVFAVEFFVVELVVFVEIEDVDRPIVVLSEDVVPFAVLDEVPLIVFVPDVFVLVVVPDFVLKDGAVVLEVVVETDDIVQ